MAKASRRHAEREAQVAKDYDKELARLHVELVKLQQGGAQGPQGVHRVREGRDGAGKGGTIKAITERVSPRVFRVVALPAPTEREKSQMYVQRYLPHLPAAGEVVIFDRSWYNRAGVERVMGFCTEEQARSFLKVVPAFEKVMVDSGIILLKYWLEVSTEEQTRRLEARIDDGRKIWKLSPMDLKSVQPLVRLLAGRATRCSRRPTRAWAPWYVGQLERQETRPPQPGHPSPEQDPVPSEAPAREGQAPGAAKAGGYREPDYPYKYIPE